MSKEEKIKKFFNERIKLRGEKTFKAEIDKNNLSGQKILDYLKKNIGNGVILDAGCGEGRFSKYFIEKGAKIKSMDFSKEYVKIAKKNIGKGDFILGSVTNIPFKDESFDYIFSVDVLQHVPKTDKAIQEFYRVLKKNGELIIIDKNKFGLNSKYFVPQKIIQKYKEATEWRYEEFKEKWFNPRKLKRKLEKVFPKATYEYLIEEEKTKIFKIIPALNLFVAWKAIKK